MHYAAFYGNLDSLKFMVKKGGNHYIVNSHDLTLMQVASQTD